MLQSENLVAGEDLGNETSDFWLFVRNIYNVSSDLTGLNGSEIIYDDASSDTSDSTNGAGS